MQTRNQQAFTILELTFVIVVIGILSAVALPKFKDTADTAYATKAQSTVTAVRSSLSTERQKRILRGDTNNITDLGDAANAFNHMSADRDGNQALVFPYPIANCAVGQRACWTRVDATHYTYTFPSASTGNDGQAAFVLQNNRFDCTAADANDCALIVP